VIERHFDAPLERLEVAAPLVSVDETNPVPDMELSNVENSEVPV
jgi:hypothetical protein